MRGFVATKSGVAHGPRHRISRYRASAFAETLLCTFLISASWAAKQPFKVSDGIETTAFIPLVDLHADAIPSGVERELSVSPDGGRWIALLLQGDLRRNGAWLTLLSGRLDSLAAATPVTIYRAFSSAKGSVDEMATLRSTLHNRVLWLGDNKRVAFFAQDENDRRQVAIANLETKEVRLATHHPTDVTSFAISQEELILYAATVAQPQNKNREILPGFNVTSCDALALVQGDTSSDGFISRVWNSELFLQRRPNSTPEKIKVNRAGVDRWMPIFYASFSPNGRWAIVDGTPDDVPEGWSTYTDSFLRQVLHDDRENAQCGFLGRQLKQLYVIDIERRSTHSLWDVPKASLLWRGWWSPDSAAVILNSTFLPVAAADPTGLQGTATAEVNVRTGQFSVLPIPLDQRERIARRVRWQGSNSIEMEYDNSRIHFSKAQGTWTASVQQESLSTETPTTIRVEVRQGLNTPSAVYAIDARTKRERMIFDPNPQLLQKFTLGKVEYATWTDPESRTWKGLLYYPVDTLSKRPFPLVIQTNGSASSGKFSLYGRTPGLGPGISIFSAQALANRGIGVLQIENKEIEGVEGTAAEPEMYMRTYEAAINNLAGKGLIEPKKVGLSGFSRTGWHVEYALTHSSFPYAAAVTSDNASGSYLEATLWSGQFENEIGVLPFGKGLETWFARAPGFNVERIRTPLRLQLESGGLVNVLSKWEMFSRLRQLGKPVELYVVPDIEHGSHALQNPEQVFASQEGTVDWFDFWLQGHEDITDAHKSDQYVRWRQLLLRRDH